MCHGDIKAENVLLTSWGWTFLADFAPYKPVHLPADNPVRGAGIRLKFKGQQLRIGEGCRAVQGSFKASRQKGFAILSLRHYVTGNTGPADSVLASKQQQPSALLQRLHGAISL